MVALSANSSQQCRHKTRPECAAEHELHRRTRPTGRLLSEGMPTNDAPVPLCWQVCVHSSYQTDALSQAGGLLEGFDYALWMDADNHLVADCCEDLLGTLVALRHGWSYSAGAVGPLVPGPLTIAQDDEGIERRVQRQSQCCKSRSCECALDAHPGPCPSVAEQEFPYEGRNESQAFVPQSNRFRHYYYAGEATLLRCPQLNHVRIVFPC